MKAGHWANVARQWKQVGPPLRPSSQDLAFCVKWIERWASARGAPRVLILGVTPELYRLPWPAGTDILAVDHTPAMIKALWPGPPKCALSAEWTAMPLPPASRDLVLCDGGAHLLAHPEGHRAWVRELRRVLSPGGLCLLRLFVPPRRRETPAAVLQDLLDGRIANLNLLKLRLAMALCEDAARAVELRLVWDTLHAVAPDLRRLAVRIGWPADHLSAINTYRDCRDRYSFLTVAEVRRLFCGRPGGFAFEGMDVPTYELGDRCPTVVLRRAGRFRSPGAPRSR